MHLGSIRLTALSGGRYKLDGGTMFGIIPKALWERTNPADERNRIDLETACPLIEIGGHTVLVDTGRGIRFSPKERDIYGIDPSEHVIASLARQGLKAEDVDMVILSHLHFDHAGAATTQDAQGRFVQQAASVPAKASVFQSFALPPHKSRPLTTDH